MAADNTIDLVINQKASFEVTFTVKEANTAVANAAAGQVTMSLTPTQTANLSLQRYFYDYTITANTGFKTRIVEGTVKVSGGVS